MKKIAICIPTFNRPCVVLDTTKRIMDTIDNALFDLYIYDSSTDDGTKKVLEEIEQKNIFYIKIDPSIHSSKKVYDIYQYEEIQGSYEYLWILADYLSFDEMVIHEIFDKLNERWDMLMLDFYDPEKRGSRQYFSPNEIFYEYAWSMTQYGIMILNCETVLKKADWDYLTKKYLVDGYKNFSHIIMYFETMLSINGLRFYHFSFSKENVHISEYKSSGSDYLDDFLNVWGYCWYQSINALPSYYKNRSQVIKMACRYTKSLGEKNLAELKIRGILTIRHFRRYVPIWHCISTVPLIVVYMIIFLPNDIVRQIAKYGSVKVWIKYSFFLMRLKRFCKKNKVIYLYGAGSKAKRIAALMIDNSILFDGFVVTETDGDTAFLMDHRVIGISGLKEKSKPGIIIAVNKKNEKEIIPLLYAMGYRNLIKTDRI